jgi:hypothetical protein
MDRPDWKEEVRKHFENVRVIEQCQGETLQRFEQFTEFIVEPAFEALADELKTRGVRVRFKNDKGRSLTFILSFPGSSEDQFFYSIVLPKNAIDLKLRLAVRCRQSSKGPWVEEEGEFAPGLMPSAIMKIAKEDLILALLERYKDLVYRALTNPE